MNDKIIINARFLTQQITGVQRYAIEICLCLSDHSAKMIPPVALK